MRMAWASALRKGDVRSVALAWARQRPVRAAAGLVYSRSGPPGYVPEEWKIAQKNDGPEIRAVGSRVSPEF
jgi:hypothetical protein